jgi:hypothetical protein
MWECFRLALELPDTEDKRACASTAGGAAAAAAAVVKIGDSSHRTCVRHTDRKAGRTIGPTIQ